MNGTLFKWFPEKKYGFARPDGKAFDVFVHRNNVTEGVLHLDARLEFKLGPDDHTNHRQMATDIKVVS